MYKKLIIVTHDYQPILSARAIRWSALAEYWATQGHDVDVVSAWQNGFAEEETLRGVRVHRTNLRWLENLRAWFKKARTSRKRQNAGQSSEAERLQAKGFLSQIAHWGYHKIYKQLYWPDGAFPWFRPALRKTRALISSNRYDALITVSPYFTAHLVGLRVHQKFPTLHWMVDIGDPFSFEEYEPHNNPRLYKTKNFSAEQRVFNKATVISVTTDETRQKYAQLFPSHAEKIHVIPPLLSSDEGFKAYLPLFPKDKKLRLVYMGRLYSESRRPDFLLQLFRSLLETPLGDHIELHFFGDIRAVEDSFHAYTSLIHEKIHVHGQVEHEIANRALHDASVLINIGNKSAYQLPSKVVEYVNTGKPILNIIQTVHDSSMKFFEPYPSVLHLHDSGPVESQKAVEDLFQFLSNLPAPLSKEEIREIRSQFQIDSIARKYEDLF
jgi:hypothetical protein